MQAQPGDPSGFDFLRLAPSARAAALGGAFGAVDDGDVTGLFYNPALLIPRMHRTVSLSYLNHLSDVNAGFVAYSHHVERLATVGVGLRFLSWGELVAANEFGERTGTFGAGDTALTLGLARALGTHWRYGANLHVIYSYIESARATALAVDLGVLYRLPAQQIAISASVNNFGRALDSFGPTRNTLPVDVRLSLTKTLRYLPLLLSVTAYNLHDLDATLDNSTTLDNVLAHIALGGELRLTKAFRARVGYNHRRSKELALTDRLDAAGLSIGFGVLISRLHVDYAYNSWSKFGGLHWFTLRMRL